MSPEARKPINQTKFAPETLKRLYPHPERLAAYPSPSATELMAMTKKQLTTLFVEKVKILNETLPHGMMDDVDDFDLLKGAGITEIEVDQLPKPFISALPARVERDQMYFQVYASPSSDFSEMRIAIGRSIPVSSRIFTQETRYEFKVKDGELQAFESGFRNKVVLRDGKLITLPDGTKEVSEQEKLDTARFANLTADTIKAMLTGEIRTKVSTLDRAA